MSDKSTISNLTFIDLYIGEDFVEATGLEGGEGPAPLPAIYAAQVEELRVICKKVYEQYREDEFPVKFQDVRYRVAYIRRDGVGDIYFLRKTSVKIMAMPAIGLRDAVREEIVNKENTGMVIVVGAMTQGKSTTAASIFSERLSVFGGIGFAAEDPPETPLDGRLGNARCIQVWARRRAGGYREAIRQGLRSGASAMFLGEIRDGETANEACLAASNGQFTVATMHGGSITEALQRICDLRAMPHSWELLASSLSLVIWQRLERKGNVVRVTNEVLFVRKDESVKAKLRAGKIQELGHDIKEQKNRNWYGS